MVAIVAADQLARAAEVVRDGGVIAYPTDTFYGLGCDPFAVAAVERLFSIKRRDANKPILLIAADLEAARRCVSTLPGELERLWPGPLTVVLAAGAAAPPAITGESGSVAVRVPDHDLARELARQCGGLLTATSANLSGAPAKVTARDVADELGDRIDLVLDGGRLTGGQPSTLLDLRITPARLLREGPMSVDRIAAAGIGL